MSLRGRSEKRFNVAVKAYLQGHEVRNRVEEVVTENVSSRGARILAKQRWQPGERLLVAAVAHESRGRARVVYCQPGPRRTFYIGVELEGAGDWWDGTVARVAGGQAQNAD